MATQIVIANAESILIDNDFLILWADKGKNWNNSWLPSTIHYVVWNSQGPNEIQNKDANGIMIGNTALSATSNAVGTTTIADLLTWGETRQLQIQEAILDYEAAGNGAEGTASEGKTWRDYDSNYS